MNDRVHADSLVTLHYRLRTLDGTELVSTFAQRPATLQLGNGELAPPLEACLVGMSAGERRATELPPERAFGPRNEQFVQRIALADLPAGTDVVAHGTVDIAGRDGQRIAGTVLSVDADSALIDFNHPLAGRALHFEVELIGVI